jgi:hypothetical protein
MSASYICKGRSFNLDITSITSKNNKAALYLVDLLIKNKDEHIFPTIRLLLSKVDKKFNYLFENGIFSDYMYDLVYDDYKRKIEERINDKYKSFVLNIMCAKYKLYIEKIKKICENSDADTDDDYANDSEYKVLSDEFTKHEICEYDEESFHGFS